MELILVGAFILVVTILVLLPRYGYLSRRSKGQQLARKTQIEDSLKLMYDLETKGRVVTDEEIAREIKLSDAQAEALIGWLQSSRLVEVQNKYCTLTPEGRSYALRVIRIHRLLERYLAEETGVEEHLWHTKAEDQEHTITAEEAEKLAVNMGNPQYDPHGDPIPTSSGNMPPQQGIALRELSAGQSARILHVEDEPPAVYAQLVAQGVYPGVFVHVLGKEIDRLRLEIGGNEQMLAPILADNINVLPIEKTVVQEGTILTLAELRPGHDAIVSEISKGCRGPQRRRLLDLGIVPGTVIKSEVESMAGDPTAYRVRGATIALRKQQARMIYVRKGDE